MTLRTGIRYINQLPLAGQRVLMRCDFNVAMNDVGEIADDTRIRAALPSIEYALANDARLILASHLGRPKGTPDSRYSLKPVAARLSQLLGEDVLMGDDCVGDNVKRRAEQLHKAGITGVALPVDAGS